MGFPFLYALPESNREMLVFLYALIEQVHAASKSTKVSRDVIVDEMCMFDFGLLTASNV
jgi:hypothetical protein